MRRLAALALVLVFAGCGEPDKAVMQGYVEGEFLDLAPEVGGRIAEIGVRRGDSVAAGALLFRLDDTQAQADLGRARADLARAEADAANLREGQRPEELSVIDAQIAQAEAAASASRKEYKRQEALLERGVASPARVDDAREAMLMAEARLAEANRQRSVARLPARSAVLESAVHTVEAARAGLAKAERQLAEHEVHAPEAGAVMDVFYETGEVAGPSAPVVSLLPPGRRKIVFYVAEPLRLAVREGGTVLVFCDGCPPDLAARVSFLATEAEFTPPVIFSRETRDKLVFRAEAALEGASLPVGQPVSVALPAGAG